jgi:SRSO17 transposase
LRDVVRDDAVETLAEPEAVLVVDETGFLKQGKASCGVGRQDTGSAGKITNCRIGVFAAYVSGKGHAFIDRALYLPKPWTEDRARRVAAHVPEEIAFATKPQLARAMIERGAIGAGMLFAPRLPAAAASAKTDRPKADGRRPTASMAWARSRWRSDGPAGATTCWA